ncbi:hypothetical protein N6H14_09210 [Paenibacillus sp. CC-CFT747]|nr:hypothetical protein N6H14_09210 [Paenibacillus sp. CC-CFT747]
MLSRKSTRRIVSCLLLVTLFTSLLAPALQASAAEPQGQTEQLRQWLQALKGTNAESAAGPVPLAETSPETQLNSLKIAELTSLEPDDDKVTQTTYSPSPASEPSGSMPPTMELTGGTFMAADAADTVKISTPVPGISSKGGGRSAAVSGDGRYIAYVAGSGDILYHDRVTELTKRITTGYDGQPANAYSYQPVVSMEGRYVLFASGASNLVPSASGPPGPALYLYDHSSAELRLVGTGLVLSNGSQPYSLSASGRYAAFTAAHDPSGQPDENAGNLDLYHMDLWTGESRRIVSGQYTAANIQTDVSMSADGNAIAFTTERKHPADGVETDTKGNRLFVFDVPSGRFEVIGRTLEGRLLAAPEPRCSARTDATWPFNPLTTSWYREIPFTR